MVYIEVGLSIGFAVGNHTDTLELDFTAEEWEALPQDRKDMAIDEALNDWANNYIETYANVVRVE